MGLNSTLGFKSVVGSNNKTLPLVTIQIVPGEYDVLPMSSDLHILINAKSAAPIQNVSTDIDMTGVVLVHQFGVASTSFSDVSDISWHGPTIEYDQPNFSQGTVLSVDARGFIFQLHNGFTHSMPSLLNAAGMSVIIYDPKTRLMKANVSEDIWLKSDYFSLISGSRYRADTTAEDFLSSNYFSTGDLVVLSSCIGGHAISISGHNLRFSDLTVLGSPCMGIVSSGGKLAVPNYFRNVVITRNPKVIGNDSRSALLGSNSDCFHQSSGRHGPVIDNSTFTFCGDDAVAIHGQYMLVNSSYPVSHEILLDVTNNPDPVIGDVLYCYNLDSGFFGTTKVVNVRLLDTDLSGLLSSPTDVFPGGRPGAGWERPAVIKIEPWLGDLPGYSFMMNWNQTGANYSVSNTNVGFNRARGLFLQGVFGVADKNYVSRTAMVGIAVYPDLWFGQSSLAQSIVLSNNAIEHAGVPFGMPGIQVSGMAEDASVAGFFNTNITLINNTFVGIRDGVLGIDVSDVNGLVMQNNRFVDLKCTTPKSIVTNNSLIKVNNALNVYKSGNIIICANLV